MAWNVRTNVKLAIKRGAFILYNDDASLFKLTTDVYNLLIPYVNDIDFGDISGAYSNNESGGRNYDFYNMERLAMTPYFCDIGLLSLQLAVGEEIIIYNPDLGNANALVLRAVNNYGNAPLRVEFGSIINGTKRYSGWYRNVGLESDRTYGTLCIGMIADPDLFRARFYVLYGYDYSQTGSSTKSANLRWFNHTGYPSPSLNEIFRNDWYIAAHEWIPPTPPTPSSDPYADGGYSDTMEGSTGDFDDTSDTIAEPTAPALSAVDSGLITLYGVDRTNIRAFASYLFGSSFDPANFHKLFESPMEAILCLNYMPYTPSSAAATATEISFGAAGTGANGRVIGNQYETIDCGTLDLKEFYGSCLDYSPYTTVTLVLPYASAVDIDPDEFNTKTIGIKYRIDNYTGAGLVLISDGTSVLMQIPCTVANPLPISASNYSSIVSAIANTAIVSAGAILAVATGGVGTGAAIALAGGVAASTAGNVMSAKLHYNHGGAGGMGTGMFGVQKPYLIIKRPRQCLPDGNNSFQGYPTFCTKNLGNVSGFTKVFQIHLDSIPATDAEKKELETILKGGVWF